MHPCAYCTHDMLSIWFLPTWSSLSTEKAQGQRKVRKVWGEQEKSRWTANDLISIYFNSSFDCHPRFYLWALKLFRLKQKQKPDPTKTAYRERVFANSRRVPWKMSYFPALEWKNTYPATYNFFRLEVGIWLMVIFMFINIFSFFWLS